jgi:molecular chaperone GrpE
MNDPTKNDGNAAPPLDGEGEVKTEASGGGETAELRLELENQQDRYLRLAAEFDNFRRRSLAQMGDSEIRAQAKLIGTLLQALDDMGRVTSLDPEAATVESVLEGVALVERKLYQLLNEAGLEEVNPEGAPFDPNVMEAMMRVPTDSAEEDDTVDQVFQRGFRFRGHLVRPARVSVRKLE